MWKWVDGGLKYFRMPGCSGRRRSRGKGEANEVQVTGIDGEVRRKKQKIVFFGGTSEDMAGGGGR